MIPAHPQQQKPNVVLIIMAKAPISGRCNTRLAPRLGLRGAARLQQHLIAHRVQHAVRTGLQVELHTWPRLTHPAFLRARRIGVTLKRQVEGDLGQRMRQAQQGRAAIIIGTDCPMLDTTRMLAAAKSVAAGQSTCIPADDGGYVLLGLPRQTPGVFQGIHWGSNQVMAQTRQRFRRQPFGHEIRAALSDLDTPADYRQHRQNGLLPSIRAR